jgi:predicted nucleotidyltransferase
MPPDHSPAPPDQINAAAEALRFAEALTRSCAEALGPTVASVILHGSLVLGDYLPGRSDVDLLVVVDDPLTDAQFDALTEAVAVLRPQAPGRVDLRVVTRQVAASPTPAPPWKPTLRSPRSPKRVCTWSASIRESVIWWWSSRCAVPMVAACWARPRPS